MDIVKELYGEGSKLVGLGVYGKKAQLLVTYLQLCMSALWFVSFNGNSECFQLPVEGDDGGISTYSRMTEAGIFGSDGKPVTFGFSVGNPPQPGALLQNFIGVGQKEDGEVCAVVFDTIGTSVDAKQKIFSYLSEAMKQIEKTFRKLGSFTILVRKTTELKVEFDCSLMISKGKYESAKVIGANVIDNFEASLMNDVEEEDAAYTAEEAKAIIEDACAVAYGKPVDRSREWLKPETDIIKVEAAKVKRAAYGEAIQELMTSYMHDVEESIAASVKNTVKAKRIEIREKLKEKGFDRLL